MYKSDTLQNRFKVGSFEKLNKNLILYRFTIFGTRFKIICGFKVESSEKFNKNSILSRFTTFGIRFKLQKFDFI